MVRFLNDSDEGPLGGVGYTIEIDESAFKKKAKYGRGKHHKDRWVFGIVERDPTGQRKGRGRFFAVPNRNRQTLLSIIMKHIKPGTTIMSDAWGAYKCLGGRGFNHLIVNHKNGFTDRHANHVCMKLFALHRNVLMALFKRRQHIDSYTRDRRKMETCQSTCE